MTKIDFTSKLYKATLEKRTPFVAYEERNEQKLDLASFMTPLGAE